MGPGRFSDDPAMQAYGHHLGAGGPLFVQNIKAVLGCVQEDIGCDQPATPELIVIDLQ